MTKLRTIIVFAVLSLSLMSSTTARAQEGGRFIYDTIVIATDSLFSMFESGQMSQDDVDRYALHFWDDKDVRVLGMKLASSDARESIESETQMNDFFLVLLKATPDTAWKAVNILMDKAMNRDEDKWGDGNSYGYIMLSAEHYFYYLLSQYNCEGAEMLLPFLDHKIARDDIPEEEKSREKNLAMLIRRNAVGSVAENFEYADYDVVVDLNGICDNLRFYRDNTPELRGLKMLMLVFFNGDSKECKDGIEGLGNSSVVMRLAESFVLSVDLICVEGFYRELWSEFEEKYPYLGIVHTDRSDIVKNNLYAMSHYPSIYILDLNGVVLLKDASVSSAIQFLIEQQERISTKSIN